MLVALFIACLAQAHPCNVICPEPGCGVAADARFEHQFLPHNHVSTWRKWTSKFDRDAANGGVSMERWAATNIRTRQAFLAAMARVRRVEPAACIYVLMPTSLALRVAPMNRTTDRAKHASLAMDQAVLASGELKANQTMVVYNLESGTYMRPVPLAEQRNICLAMERYFAEQLQMPSVFTSVKLT